MKLGTTQNIAKPRLLKSVGQKLGAINLVQEKSVPAEKFLLLV